MKISDQAFSSAFSPTSQEPADTPAHELKNEKGTEAQLPTSIELRNKPEYDLSMSDAAIKKQMERIAKLMDGTKVNLEISFHKDVHQMIVKVIDAETSKVIREIPPEKIVDMVAQWMKQAGLIIDRKM